MIKRALKLLIAFLFLSSTAFAYSGDISINEQNIRFSSTSLLEGRTVRIYATVTSYSNDDLLGVVRFYDNGDQIKSDQAISIFSHSTDDVFVDWTPFSYGYHRVAVKIFPWETDIDDPSNNWVVTEIHVIRDTDYDGIPNDIDDDDDGDTVPDTEDDFPLNPAEQYDTDGDGTGDNADTDDDNDDVPDEFDDLPLDPNETIDTDSDGVGNIADTDDDGDGLTDSEEENMHTNPLNSDSDNDGTHDHRDAFPLDSGEWDDTDDDGIGNNTDTDDDNDGITDTNDDFPLNKGPVIELEDERITINLMEEFTFDATPSYDEDGEIVSYEWEIDGEILEGNAITRTFTEPGEHNIKLTITDDAGESRSLEMQASVINLTLYKQLGATLIAILLALMLIFKYIAPVSKNNNHEERHSP